MRVTPASPASVQHLRGRHAASMLHAPTTTGSSSARALGTLRSSPMLPCGRRRMLGGPVRFMLDTNNDAMSFLAELLLSPEGEVDLDLAAAAAAALGFDDVMTFAVNDTKSSSTASSAAEAAATVASSTPEPSSAVAAVVEKVTEAAAPAIAAAPAAPAVPDAIVASAAAVSDSAAATAAAAAATVAAAVEVEEKAEPVSVASIFEKATAAFTEAAESATAAVSDAADKVTATVAAATGGEEVEQAAEQAVGAAAPAAAVVAEAAAPVEAPAEVVASKAVEISVEAPAPAPAAAIEVPEVIVAATPVPEPEAVVAAVTEAPAAAETVAVAAPEAADSAVAIVAEAPAAPAPVPELTIDVEVPAALSKAAAAVADAPPPPASEAVEAVAAAVAPAAPEAASSAVGELVAMAPPEAVTAAAAAAEKAADGAAANVVAQFLQSTGAVDALHSAVVSLAAVSPSFLVPIIATLGGDMEALLSFQPTSEGIARLLVLYYFTFTNPNPLAGILDFYLIRNIIKKGGNWKPSDFALRDKLGGGNFGTAFEAVNVSRGETLNVKVALTQDQKKRRVVLKRVNMEKGDEIRENFLSAGTMAKGPGETGFVEDYMYNKIARNPGVAKSCAEYMGKFTSPDEDRTFVKGSQWLVWKYESDSTLSNALDGQLGEFPFCLERFVSKDLPDGTLTPEQRAAAIIKAVFKQVLVGLSRLHSIGIVHRDVKPENLLITADGSIKFIDFGAAVDMSTGVNFNPQFGMLDLRYAPPEELVMPKDFPRSPAPLFAALFAPITWSYGRPDLFDSYSAGILLVQMAVPQLRSTRAARSLNYELSQVDYDVQRWREMRSAKYDFSLLDRNNEAGWELATRLICKRNFLNRGRYSVQDALSHRYFNPERVMVEGDDE